MNIFALSGILIGTTNTIMAVFMLLTFKKSNKKQHFIWGLFCLSAVFWSVGGYKIATTTDIYLADFWWRITHIGIIFIPIFFTHFVLSFLEIKRPKFLITLYSLGILFLATNFIDGLFITNIRLVFNQFYYDSPPGIFYIPFTIMFFGLVIYSHIELWKAYKNAQGLTRTQIKYFFFGMAVSFIGGGLSFLPVYKIDIYPVLNLLACLFPIIIAYAITRYRLMDIRIAVRKSAVYFLAAVFSYGFFYFSTWILTRLFGGVYAPGALFLGAFLAVCFASMFFFVEKLINFIANKYFFADLYGQHETLRKLSERITSVVDFKKLVGNVTTVIKNTLKVEKIAFALKIDDDGFEILKYAGFKKERLTSLLETGEIAEYFSKYQKSLLLEELDKKKHVILRENLEKNEAIFLLPLICNNKLQGVIILGKKINNDAYSQEDFRLLTSLSHQTALAIENAKLYDKLENWNNSLKEKVAEQTDDIRKKNASLKKLLEMRTEFLHTASHQLRTPVSAIKGLVSMLKEGDFEDMNKAIKDQAYEGIFNKTQKMTNILDDILIAAELDTKENYKLDKSGLKSVDIGAITNKVMCDLEPLAKERGVKVISKFKVQSLKLGERDVSVSAWMTDEREVTASKTTPQPSPVQLSLRACPEPVEWADSQGGGSLFVLSNEINLTHILRNLLNNAIMYTPRGGKVEIGIEITNSKLKISNPKFGERDNLKAKIKNLKSSIVIWRVKDDGIGVPAKSKKYIFDKFKRGVNANKLNCDGSGLGLFIVKKLVEAHPNAEVGFTSEEDKGSEFWVKFTSA